MLKVLYCLTAWIVLTLSYAHTIVGQLDSDLLPLSTSELATTTVVLRDLQYRALSKTYLQEDGRFMFLNVPNNGSLLVDFESVAFAFNGIYRIDIASDGSEAIHKVFYGHDFITDLGPTLESPIHVEAKRNTFLIPRPAFNFWAILKSPMILMSIASLVLVFAVPKLVENLDPEALEQLQQHQAQRNEAMEKVANFDMAAYIANKRGETSETSTSS